MKLPTILALLLVDTSSASARNIMDWNCGDHVTVSITVSAAHKTGLGHLTHSIEIGGLRDPARDRVTFKLVPSEYGYRVFGAYLNGQGNSLRLPTGLNAPPAGAYAKQACNP